MAIPVITNPRDQIVTTVRECAPLLLTEGTATNAQVLSVLNNHAFPHIRAALMMAKEASENNQGALIFLNNLADLSDNTKRVELEQTLNDVMLSVTLKDEVYRIAAAWTAGNMLSGRFGQVKQQAELAKELRDEAKKALETLVKSPLPSAALAEVRAAADQAEAAKKLPRIYFALDVDPTTYNSTLQTMDTYTGAQEAGTASLAVGPFGVSVPVAPGDRPSEVMQALYTSLRALQAANVNVPNVVIGVNEGAPLNQYRMVEWTMPTGGKQKVSANINVNLGYIEFNAYMYDDQIDALFCMMELKNADNKLGIKGFLYGTEADYGRLSQMGPYSAFIDLSTSKLGNANPNTGSTGSYEPDTFWFQVPSGTTTAEGLVKYQISNMVANPVLNRPTPLVLPYEVVIPAGSTAMDVVVAVALDMHQRSYLSRVLPGIRSPASIEIMGSPTEAPGLKIVPYRPSGFEDKVVFDILSVPDGVIFGFLPPTMVTNNAFDSQPKSLTLSIRFVKEIMIANGVADGTGIGDGLGDIRLTEHIITPRLRRAWDDINFYGRGY